MKQRPPQSRAKGGFALIITVIIVALLTIMAVAFLSSSTLERATSRASVNRMSANLAAKAAVDVAVARLIDNLTQYPDSSTSWDAVTDAAGKPQYEGTVLYYHELTPEKLNNPPPPAPTATPSLYVLPLISGAVAKPTPNPSSGNKKAREAALQAALPVLDDNNSFDVNHARFSGDLQGWVGSSPQWKTVVPTPTKPQPFRAQWINLTDSDNKITGRYAYWMEDESFKANVNHLGKIPRGSATLGVAPSEIPLQGVIKAVLGSTDSVADGIATDIFDFRSKFRSSFFFEQRDLNHVSGHSTLGDDLKFISTIQSAASNLSRSGSRRVSLNNVAPTSTDPNEIRKQLDEIIKTITYHSPNFGQRFYRTGSNKNSLDVVETSSSPHRTIYLNKLAANIRDYIDSDSQPTVVNNDGDPTGTPPKAFSVRLGPPPGGATWKTPPTNALVAQGGGATGPNEVIAIGKERVPLLQEYLLRVKQLVFTNRIGASAQYKIEVDHYLEFWNMTNRDIAVADLGPDPFLGISNQFGWDATGATPGTDIPEGAPRDFSVLLSKFQDANGNPLIFRAGVPTVLTTDPSPLPSAFNVDAAKIFRPSSGQPPDALRVYQGTTSKKSGSELRLASRMRPTATGSDAETELFLGNNLGMIESFSAPFIANISVNIDNPSGSEKFDISKYHYRGSSLQGNKVTVTAGQTGDARTNWEQLAMSTSTPDRTRYLQVLASNNVPDSASITAPNSNYVDPTQWIDAAQTGADAARAPSVVANQPLKSIGELGHIFDPVRLQSSGGDIKYSRGGGRTLKVGQSEMYDSSNNAGGLWDGDSDSASREWVAWRLTDIFSATDALLLDGRININGATRDDGSALRTALYGYNFQASPDSDPQLGSAKLNDTTVQEIVKQLKARIVNDSGTYSQFSKTSGPLMERGELSELPIFNPGTDLATSASGPVYDRGREEIFRRLAELITTRGNFFTVYAVGQTLSPQAAGATPRVLATSTIRVTFRLDPVWTAGPPTDPFDPSTPTSLTARFKKPDRYDVKIVYARE